MPTPVSGDRDDHVGSAARFGRCLIDAPIGGYRQASSGRHGVAGIGGKVDDDALEPARIDPHHRLGHSGLDDYRDVLSEQPWQHRPNRADKRVHIMTCGTSIDFREYASSSRVRSAACLDAPRIVSAASRVSGSFDPVAMSEANPPIAVRLC